MKTRKLFLHLMVVVFAAMISTNAWAVKSETFSSNFKISPDMNFSPTADYQKSWEIAYGEFTTPVHVYLKQTQKGQEYVVRSKYFEVKYVNGEQGFGAKLVNGNERTITENLNNAVLNKTQLDNQKCISRQAIASDQILEMIASYLPDLINEQYRGILN